MNFQLTTGVKLKEQIKSTPCVLFEIFNYPTTF